MYSVMHAPGFKDADVTTHPTSVTDLAADQDDGHAQVASERGLPEGEGHTVPLRGCRNCGLLRVHIALELLHS